MRIDVVTLLPQLFEAFLTAGVCGRAFEDGKASARFWNPRHYAPPPHRVVDDRPYGGGSGMVLQAAPIMAAARAARAENPDAQAVYLTPRGERFDDLMARELAARQGLLILCGRYRGVDERAVELFGGREVSVGDYVLSGGEPAAMVLIDAVLRHVPGVLGNPDSPEEDAFADRMLDAPCYTRPPVFEGKAAPAVLLSGDHRAIDDWRRKMARRLTSQRRPDLLKK